MPSHELRQDFWPLGVDRNLHHPFELGLLLGAAATTTSIYRVIRIYSAGNAHLGLIISGGIPNCVKVVVCMSHVCVAMVCFLLPVYWCDCEAYANCNLFVSACPGGSLCTTGRDAQCEGNVQPWRTQFGLQCGPALALWRNLFESVGFA